MLFTFLKGSCTFSYSAVTVQLRVFFNKLPGTGTCVCFCVFLCVCAHVLLFEGAVGVGLEEERGNKVNLGHVFI